MIEKYWAEQLLKEHQEICWYYNVKLKTPVIRITESPSTWGSWEHFSFTLSISRRLIENYSWDIVQEILKHEMAHQYVSEIFGSVHDTSHGESFKKACKVLGVATWAQAAGGELPNKLPTIKERNNVSEESQLYAKIEKLLALSQSAEEHESHLAMQKAQELLERYKLSATKLSKDTLDLEMDSLFLKFGTKKTSAVQSKILGILSRHFHVQAIHLSLFDASRCEKLQAAEILGRRENVVFAEYAFHFLSQQCTSLWRQHQLKEKCPNNMKRSFQLGILVGFDEKLTKSALSFKQTALRENLSTEQSRELLVLENQHLHDFVQRRYPRLQTRSTRRSSIHSEAFQEGKREGSHLNINQPISSSKFGGFLNSAK